jgi:hypothetical protein
VYLQAVAVLRSDKKAADQIEETTWRDRAAKLIDLYEVAL